ncbi:MAG: hypothetical protein H0V48_11745 [Nocardioidaceae bacterium]|nr:hypothetical protein [Nocardioidaceae bacterium]
MTVFLDAGDNVDGGDGRDRALVLTDREAGLVWDLGSGVISAPVAATAADFEDISATEGADTITGTAQRELFFTFGGDDTVTAGGGDDYLAGYNGDDLLDAGDGTDKAFGGPGTDECPGAETARRCES